MARVPVIQDSEQLDTNTGRQRIQADANAFGGQEAQALQSVQQGLNTVARVAEEKYDEFSEAEARESDNELARRLRERLTGPEGYLSTQLGRNAIDRRAQTEAEVDEIAAEIGGRITNQRARTMYLNAAQTRVGDSLGRIAEHSARETTSYHNAQSEARLLEFADEAAASYGEEGRVLEILNGADDEIRTLGGRRGWDDDIIDQRIRQFRSGVMSRTIVLLAGTDPEAAREMYALYRPSLSAQEAGELETTMRAIERDSERNIINEAWIYVSEGRAIPADLWARVPGSARIDIQERIRIQREGGAGGGDRALFNDLVDLSIRQPEAFALTRLELVRGRLGENFYGAINTAQARLIAGEPRAGLTTEQAQGAMRLAYRQLSAAGYNLRADADDVERRAVADFQSDLIGLLDRHVEENGTAPNAPTQMLAITNLLATRGSNPDGWFNNRQWRATDDYTPLAQIPAADQRQIEAALRADGIPVTRGNIERAYEMRQSALRAGGGE